MSSLMVRCPECRGTGTARGLAYVALCSRCWGHGYVAEGPQRARGPFQHLLEAFDRARRALQ